MSKRGNNEGSVYQRKDGRWVGQMQIGYKPDGTRKFVNYYGRTRHEVANKLSDSLAQFNHGIFVEPSNITYADWMKYWVKNFRKSYIRGTTYARYISFLDVHILPELGNLKLQNIKSTHIQKFYNKLTDEGMSPASIKHLHSILRQSFAEAIIEKYMVQNPCDYVTRPRVVYKQVTVFTPEPRKMVYHLSSLESFRPNGENLSHKINLVQACLNYAIHGYIRQYPCLLDNKTCTWSG